jgi:hypothetical protein
MGEQMADGCIKRGRLITHSITPPTEYPYQWAYNQSIKRMSDGKTIMSAIFYSTCVNANAENEDEKMYIPESIRELIL